MADILAGCRVMVVEDELLISMLIEDTLLDEGCVVIGPYTTVQDALSAAKQVSIDFAILDVNLRGEKVYPVAEILSERGIPFVLLSGYGLDAIPPDRPHWDAVSKPFSAHDLIAKLAEQIERRSGPTLL